MKEDKLMDAINNKQVWDGNKVVNLKLRSGKFVLAVELNGEYYRIIDLAKAHIPKQELWD